MSDSNKSGRTPWDALVEVLSTSRLLLLMVSLFLTLFFVVHFSAEPETAVEFFGVVKYQKGKSASEPPKAQVDESNSYALPKNIQIQTNQTQGIPILDGTLSVMMDGILGGKIVGPSIGKIRVACRGLDGTPNGLTRPFKDNETILFLPGTLTEIEYRGRVFAMTAKARPENGMTISIVRVPHATLDLVAVKDLQIPESSE
jgi:hypothetical protein